MPKQLFAMAAQCLLCLESPNNCNFLNIFQQEGLEVDISIVINKYFWIKVCSSVIYADFRLLTYCLSQLFDRQQEGIMKMPVYAQFVGMWLKNFICFIKRWKWLIIT